MKNRKEVRKEYQELLRTSGVSLMKILDEQDEKASSGQSFDPVDVVGKIIGKMILRKIQDFLDGDRGYSFGGVKWHVDGQTGKGSISVQVGTGWLEIVVFTIGDSASVVLGTGLAAINSLVANGTISAQYGRKLKSFLFIAIIEMINQGVLVDDLEATTHIEKINEFVEGTVLDERFGEGEPK